MTQNLIPVYRPDTEEDLALAVGLPPGADATYIIGFRGASNVKSFRYNARSEKGIAIQTNPSRRTVTVKNQGANDVFIGGEDVTVEQGYLLSATDALTLELSGELWVVTVSTVEPLHIITEVDAGS